MAKPLRLQIFAAVRRLLPWVAIGCVLLALSPRASELKLSLSRISASSLVIALGLSLAYWFLNAGVWSWILESLGHPIPYFSGVKLWLTSESLRWLPGPGSIYGFCSRITAARDLGVPLAIASLSLPLELSTVVLAWGIVAGTGLAFSGLGVRLAILYFHLLVPAGLVALAALLGFIFAWPILRRQARFVSVLERFQALASQPLRRRALWRASLVYVGLNAFHGLGLWLMLSALGYSHSISPAAAIGANATGWLLGFFAIGIPGGIGVREAGVALVLSPLIPWQEATLAAGLWRIVQIAAELFALLPWLFIRGGTGKKKILPTPINGHLLEELP